MIHGQKLESEVEKSLRKLHNIKRLNKKQKEVAKQITGIIIANEEKENWASSVENYLKKPIDKHPKRVKQVEKIAFEHDLDYYLASILLASKV